MRKVLLVGWDAADWDVVRPLVAAGILPNLAKLIDAGTAGPLRAPPPLLSATGWANIITGKRATRHGVFEPQEPRPDRMGLRLARRHARMSKAVWEILASENAACHVVNFPTTHPAEALGGVTVSNVWTNAKPGDPPCGMVHPPELEPKLSAMRIGPVEVKEKSLQWFMPKLAALREPLDTRPDVVAAAIAQDHSVHEAITWAMRNAPWSFAAVVYTGLHQLSHAFMQCRAPRLPWVAKRDVELYGQVIEAAYQYLDIMLGQLVELAGPQTVVMVVSDHGFRSGDDRPAAAPARDKIQAWHRAAALGVIAGPGVSRGAMPEDASLFDVTPTILSLFGLPIGRDMDGGVWREALPGVEEQAPIDWWDADVIPACAWPDEPDAERDAAEDASVAYLRSLGYSEQPDPFASFAIRRTLADELLNSAVAQLQAGAPAAAVSVLEPLVAEWPQFAEYRIWLARAYRGAGDEDSADLQEFLAQSRTFA